MCRLPEADAATVTDVLPLSFTDDVLDMVVDHEVYSFLDGFSNYNQIRIHRKIKRKWLLSPNGGCLLHW